MSGWLSSPRRSKIGDRDWLEDTLSRSAATYLFVWSSRASRLARRMSLDTRTARNQLRVLDRCLGEHAREVRVRVERVGEGDTGIAIRDIPLRYQNRRQLLPGQHLLQVSQHARIRQRQRVALGGPQDIVGAALDDRELAQLLRHLLGPALPVADAEVA